MLFIVTLSIITFSIAACAAFFSVYGLANTFTAAFYAVIFMGTALEAGKLMTASFLYRYWQKISWMMKTYLSFAVLILMIITSVGIFAFLSKGYQEDTLSLKELDKKISHLNTEITSLQDRKTKIEDSKQAVIASVAGITDNTRRWQANTKSQLANSVVGEDKGINERLQVLTTELYSLEDKKINTQLHVGPVIYIAQALGTEVDDATKYIILLLIIVFDPLAVALTIGVNVALTLYKQEKQLQKMELDIINNIDTANSDIIIESQGATVEIHPHINELIARKQIIEDIRTKA